MYASRRNFLLKTFKAGATLTFVGHARSQGATTASSDPGTPLSYSNPEEQKHINVDSIKDMLLLKTTDWMDGQQIIVKGYHPGTDIGGGTFYWDETSIDAGNNGTVFEAETGRFRKIFTPPIDICDFGAIPGEKDSTAVKLNCKAISLALKHVKSVKVVNYGKPYHSLPCSFNDDDYKGISIVGEGFPEWSGSITLQTSGVIIHGIIFDGSWQEKSTNSHLIRMRQGCDYTIRDCQFKNLIVGDENLDGSDGIYIRSTLDTTGFHISNVLIENCKFYDLSRQAVSIIQGENIIITDCYSSTRRAFVDVEPNGTTELTRFVHIRDSYVDGERLGVTYISETGTILDAFNGQGYGIEFHNSSGPNPPSHNHHCSAENIYIIGNRHLGGKRSPGLKARRTMCTFKNIYCKHLAGANIFEFSGETTSYEPITININNLYLVDSGTTGEQILESYNNDTSFNITDSVFSNVKGFFRGTGLHKITGSYFYNCGQHEKAFILGYTTSHAPRHILNFTNNEIVYDEASSPPAYFIKEPDLNITIKDTWLRIENNHVQNSSNKNFNFISARNVARHCLFSKNTLINVDGVIEFKVYNKGYSQLLISENNIILQDGSSIDKGFALALMASVKIVNNNFSGGLNSPNPILALIPANDYTIIGNTFNATSMVDPYIKILDGVGSAVISGNTFLSIEDFHLQDVIQVDSKNTIVEEGLNVYRVS